MSKIKYCFFAIFVVLSFYFTDQIMLYIDNKNPLMQEIISVTDEYNTKAVDAIIENDTIIPGVKGKEINKHKSLIKMEEFGAFNETYLIYNLVKPNISLDDNKDKTIIRGNTKKRNISLILEENKVLEDYLNTNNIKYDIIASLKTNLNINREYINGELDKSKSSDFNSILNKKNLNKKICLVNYSNIDYCKSKNYYIVSYSISTKTNYMELINKLDNGEIILVAKETSLDYLKNLVKEIKRLDLNIIYLSELISE